MSEEITYKCIALNRKIHSDDFFKKFFKTICDEHTKTFTSLDLIEDCQNAIDEFVSLPDNILPERSTLYIYGALQSLYCQQDGLLHLYQVMCDPSMKSINTFFDLFNFDKNIRKIRDDIAGHPTSRNYGKEYYFISKGYNTKYSFEYAGYKPEFVHFRVDLKQFIDKQEELTLKVLKTVESFIDNYNIENKLNA